MCSGSKWTGVTAFGADRNRNASRRCIPTLPAHRRFGLVEHLVQQIRVRRHLLEIPDDHPTAIRLDAADGLGRGPSSRRAAGHEHRKVGVVPLHRGEGSASANSARASRLSNGWSTSVWPTAMGVRAKPSTNRLRSSIRSSACCVSPPPVIMNRILTAVGTGHSDGALHREIDTDEPRIGLPLTCRPRAGRAADDPLVCPFEPRADRGDSRER